MKLTASFLLAVSSFILDAQPVSTALTPRVLAPNHVAATGPHERIWQSVTVDEQGTTNVNSYTELATGLNFWNPDTGLFEPSKERYLISKSGYAVATNGQHKIILAPDIASLGSVDLLTPSGQRLTSNPRFLSLTDESTGKSVLIAEVTNCLGELTAPNVVLYPNCFDTLRAALSYTYTRAGFEQDVILYQKVNPADYDLNPAATRLEMWSEFLSEATPQVAAADSSADQNLDFDQMRLGHGVAYMLNSQSVDTVGLEKEWIEIDSRRFLVESVPYLSVKPMLDKLQASASRPTKSQLAKVTFPDRRNLVACASKATSKPIETARAPSVGQTFLSAGDGDFRVADPAVRKGPPHGRSGRSRAGVELLREAEKAALTDSISPVSGHEWGSIRPGGGGNAPALVLDYQALNSSQTNYVFRGDMTYFISGNVSLFGSNTVFEAGTIIKSTNGVSLTVNSPVTWLATTYRPIVFCSKDDTSCGDTISGATGNPGTSYYAATALAIGSTNSAVLQNLRFANAQTALSFCGGTGHVIRHAQLLNCGTGFAATNTDFGVRNALLYNVLTNFNGATSTGRCEHLTVNTAKWLNYNSTLGLTLTNSLLVSVTNTGTYISNSVYTAAATDLQTVGAAAAYLADNSPYRNLGTTNINSSLLAALKTRTTYPPIVLTNDFTTNTTLSPQAQRDTDVLDIGWHYSPLDYVVGRRVLTNSTLLLTNGVALGTYGAVGESGIQLRSGGKLISEGSPNRPNWITRYNTVQEQANTNWSAAAGNGLGHSTTDSITPTAQFRFTHWSLLAANGYHLNGYQTVFTPFCFKDCEFAGGRFYIDDIALGITNCLFDRVVGSISQSTSATNVNLFNNLFRLGSLALSQGFKTSATLKDCLFDRTTITASGSYTHGYNGYVTGYNRLTPNQATDKVLTNAPVYLASFLGSVYYPTNDGMLSTLINAGSRYATNATLYHYTTTSDQVKEAGSMVDIGFHFAATDANGNPFDTDGDGIPDYLEDRNGNGAFDTGETDWRTYNSPNGLSGTSDLRVYTPLK